jgi:phosphoglycerol transferase MdoB-like AlkP superfamily enzyme
LDELKSKGIYDKSLIYIFGDHGEGRFEELKINTKLIDKNSDPDQTKIPIKIKSRAIPLMMIKDFYSTGELKISNKPMYLAKIPQMVFEDLDINVDNVRKESTENENHMPDTRKYYYYNWPTLDPSFEWVV